jgi:hypothetical protein
MTASILPASEARSLTRTESTHLLGPIIQRDIAFNLSEIDKGIRIAANMTQSSAQFFWKLTTAAPPGFPEDAFFNAEKVRADVQAAVTKTLQDGGYTVGRGEHGYDFKVSW